MKSIKQINILDALRMEEKILIKENPIFFIDFSTTTEFDTIRDCIRNKNEPADILSQYICSVVFNLHENKSYMINYKKELGQNAPNYINKLFLSKQWALLMKQNNIPVQEDVIGKIAEAIFFQKQETFNQIQYWFLKFDQDQKALKSTQNHQKLL